MTTSRSITQDAFAVVAAFSPTTRLARLAAMNRAADTLALAGLRRRHPNATGHTLGIALALQRIGRSNDSLLAAWLTKETTMSDTPADFLAVALRAATICTTLGIPYLIGGGVASIVHGEFRTTRDVDLIIRLKPNDATRFAQVLATDFTVNPPDIFDALAHVHEVAQDRTKRATFAAFDRQTGYQLDVFCASDSSYDRMQFERATASPLPEISATLQVASAEDTILTKLEWYAITPSDRQWDDVQAILRVQAAALDQSYLSTWAQNLHIGHLLTAALRGSRAPHYAPTTPSEHDPSQLKMDL